MSLGSLDCKDDRTNSSAGRSASGDIDHCPNVEVGEHVPRQPAHGVDAVRRHGRVHCDIHARVPHVAGVAAVELRRVLSLLRQQRRQPVHLLVHESQLPRRPSTTCL